MVEQNAPTLEELKAQMATACVSGTDADVIRIGKLITKHTQDVVKAEATKLQEEATALAGKREELEGKLFAAVKGVVNASDLVDVKAKGFTFIVNHSEDDKGRLDINGTVKVKGAVKLMVPAIKKAGGGGGGGGAGITIESQTGFKRSQLIEDYATEEEKSAIAKARTDAEARSANPNSSGWSAEKPVVKRILAEHPELIKR